MSKITSVCVRERDIVKERERERERERKCECHFSQKVPWQMLRILQVSSRRISANLANVANFKARLFYEQKNIFFVLKQSSCPSPNLPNLPNSSQNKKQEGVFGKCENLQE
jgi:hypothetical protein